MSQHSIQRLRYLCLHLPPLLKTIDDGVFALKPAPDKWSKKEILGHLIDSASHNHHRLVRGQFEELPVIAYDQNKWNTFNYYQRIDGRQIIDLWVSYNKQLLALINCIPSAKLLNRVSIGGTEVTLAFIIEDYVVHLEHHLTQIALY